MPAKVICRQIVRSSIEELNTEMKELMLKGFEPIQISATEGYVCVLLRTPPPKVV